MRRLAICSVVAGASVVVWWLVAGLLTDGRASGLPGWNGAIQVTESETGSSGAESGVNRTAGTTTDALLVQRLELLEHEVQALRFEVLRLRERREASRLEAKIVGILEDEKDDSSPDAAMSPEELTHQDNERDRAKLERRLTLDTYDRDGSADVESTVADAIQTGQLAGAKLLDATCATTLCRVRITQNDPLSRDDFLEAIAETEPMNSQGLIITNEDIHGQLEALVYFAREGHSLFVQQPQE